MIDLNELKKQTWEIYKKRVANGATIETDHLKHCAGELIEAVNAREEFYERGKRVEEKRYIKLQTEYAHELADIIICVLNEAEKANIDIENAILEVVEKNKLRAEGKGDKK